MNADNSTKIIEAINEVLSSFNDKYNIKGNTNKAKVIQDLENYNHELIEAMLSNSIIKNNFSFGIEGNTVFKLNEFIELFQSSEYWMDSYTKYSKKIGLSSNGRFIEENTDVVLDFPYKDTILKASMSKEDRSYEDLLPNEPFLNEIVAKEEIDIMLDKKIFRNVKRFSEIGEEPVSKWQKDENLLIKGNNLIALHTLKEIYREKVKLIYIDVPYNTGSDSFAYNDSFNHSTWLTFVRNRLIIAKELLRKDGSIFVHLDDNEVKYLGVIMDEIFGKNNFVELITVVNNPRGRDYGGIANMHEFIYVYRNSEETTFNPIVNTDKKFPYEDKYSGFEIRELRNRNTAFHEENRPNLFYPVYVDLNSGDKDGFYQISETQDEQFTFELLPKKSQGIQTVWRWGKPKLIENKNRNAVAKRMKDGGFSLQEKYRKNEVMARSVWWDKEVNSEKGTLHLRELFGSRVFAFPKPESTIKRIIEIGSNENDIVLDFFLGSGTTATTAMKMNRRFIGIEQMDYINTVTVPRLQKVIEGEQGGISKLVNWTGGGSFIYAELMEKNKGFLDSILHAETVEKLKEVFKLMSKTGDFNFQVDLNIVNESLWNFPLDEQKKILVKIIDKNQLYFNYSEIDDENLRQYVSDSDYEFTKSFYEKRGE